MQREVRGVITAMITPFKNGEVDYESLEKFIEFQVSSGVDGLVPCGTTGEAATLSFKEHIDVIAFTVKKVNGRIPVIAGTGSNSTKEAIELARGARSAGADAHLSVTPYYNKPTQEGLYLHFREIAEAVDLPMIMYNVPGRTGVNMLPETVSRLSQIPQIIGIKEASANLQQDAEIMEYSKPGFLLLSGEDFVNLPVLSVGGAGTISVTSNIAPGLSGDMIRSFFKGDTLKAQKIHISLLPLHRAMFLETNPIPVKTAACMMGLIGSLEMRLPLCGMKKENLEKLSAALKAGGLI
jgi:4-hydroxy-tetrahydrodipicolinate synthase